MKKNTIVIFCVLLLNGCSDRIKTYYNDGKIQSEYSVDKNNKKNGLYKIFNKDGTLNGEMEMIHDTMSGLLKYYHPKSGKLWQKILFKKGIYSIPITDSDFVFAISHYSYVEHYLYPESGVLYSYSYVTAIKNNQNTGIFVQYKDDSISLIRGTPMSNLYIYENDEKKKRNNIERLTVLNLPKCRRNFYVIDSVDKVIDSCMGECKYIDITVDRTKCYTLKVEFIDSTFKVKHSIEEPFMKLDKSKFPSGIRTEWSRE